jgi:hypothetical protein
MHHPIDRGISEKRAFRGAIVIRMVQSGQILWSEVEREVCDARRGDLGGGVE